MARYEISDRRLMVPEAIPIPKEIMEQLNILRLFNAKVDHINRSGFAKRYESEIPQVMAKFEDVSIENMGGGRFNIFGKIDSWIQDFSQDEIDAFVLTYRLFTQNNDPISINALAQIYNSSWMPPDGKVYFEEAREDINSYLSRAAGIMFGEYNISVGLIVEIIIYGGMAHTNLQKADIFNSWIESGAMGFIWAEFYAYARFVIRKLQYISDLNNQILNAIDSGSAFFYIDPDDVLELS